MKEGFVISTYRTSDRDDVVRIWQSSLHSPGEWNEPAAAIARQQAVQPDGFLVGRIQGRVVATCVVGYDGVRGWLYKIAVKPEHRGRGYGRKIVEHAEDYLRKLGCPKINLQVLGENGGVVDFYKRLGYHVQDHTSIAKILFAGGTADTTTEQGIVEMAVDDEIRLTEFRPADKQTLMRVLSESDVFARNLLAMPFPYTAADADAWLDSVSRMRGPHSSARSWAIRTADDTLVGGCGFKEIRGEHCAEVGYWLSPIPLEQGDHDSRCGSALQLRVPRYETCPHRSARFARQSRVRPRLGKERLCGGRNVARLSPQRRRVFRFAVVRASP